MQGLILAAGMGIRLQKHTSQNTKCMLEINGEKLIKSQIKALNHAGINKVVIVCGYKKENLKSYVLENFKNNEIIFVDNDEYKTTNNIYSLFLAKHYLEKDDTILIESDLIFEDSIIEKLVNDKAENIVAVSKYKSWMDGTVITRKDNGCISKIYTKKEFDINKVEKYYKTINIYKLSKEFCSKKYVPHLEEFISKNGKDEYYEVIFKELVQKDIELKAKEFKKEKWYEIDTVQDLDIAKCIFRK